LPKNCPIGVISTIKMSWDNNRQNRKTAVECLATYQFYHGIIARQTFDIFFSFCSDKVSPVATLLRLHLIRLGYRVWFDQDGTSNMSEGRHAAILDGLRRSSVMICFWSTSYQNDENCMMELTDAVLNIPSPRPVITLTSEAKPLKNCSRQFLKLTKIDKKPFVDVSSFSSQLFDAENVLTGDQLVSFQQKIQPVIKMLNDNNCVPTVDVLGSMAN